MVVQFDAFTADNAWQAAQRDKYLVSFYQRYSEGGRYVFVDKSACSTILQKQLAVDTIMQSRAGRSLCIEEKIDRRGHTTGNFALETQSWGKPGWMHYAESDYLLYAFALPTGLDVYLIDFSRLKAWFWPLVSQFPEKKIAASDSRVRLVHHSLITKNVPGSRYFCDESGCRYVSTFQRHIKAG